MLGLDGITVTGVHTRSETLPGFATNEIGSAFTRIVPPKEATAEEMVDDEAGDLVNGEGAVVGKSSPMGCPCRRKNAWAGGHLIAR